MRSKLLFLLPQLGIALLVVVLFAAQASAAEVTVAVTGVASDKGEVGCALFRAPSTPSFPMDTSVARQQWLPAAPSVTCRFGDVADGIYAMAVSHDLNGNKKTDTNFLGIPTEAWGVSNNIRPTMRAPRFDEAAFRVEGGKDVSLEVKVAK